MHSIVESRKKVVGEPYEGKPHVRFEVAGDGSQDIQQVSYRKLRMLNNAVNLNDLRIPPANRLEKLSGDRKGRYSIRINDQWRICFEWRDGDVHNVEIIDYH